MVYELYAGIWIMEYGTLALELLFLAGKLQDGKDDPALLKFNLPINNLWLVRQVDPHRRGCCRPSPATLSREIVARRLLSFA
jgi:hypothetical protein